jgi:hypothetical protein
MHVTVPAVGSASSSLLVYRGVGLCKLYCVARLGFGSRDTCAVQHVAATLLVLLHVVCAAFTTVCAMCQPRPAAQLGAYLSSRAANSWGVLAATAQQAQCVCVHWRGSRRMQRVIHGIYMALLRLPFGFVHYQYFK